MALIEIIQIVVCLIGSGFNLWGVLDAITVRSVLERRRREIEANNMRLSRELARMAIQIIMIIAALIALGIRGDTPGVYPDVIVTNKLTMIAISILSAYTSIRERIGARRLNTIALDEVASPHMAKDRRQQDGQDNPHTLKDAL
jgi:hypothetical protein